MPLPSKDKYNVLMAVWFLLLPNAPLLMYVRPPLDQTLWLIVVYGSLRNLLPRKVILRKARGCHRTDKESYHPGEPVKIIIQNVGNQPLRVSGLNYNLTIINLADNRSFPLVHGKTSILAVDSGASANAIWDRLDDKGKQVSAGNYTVLAILDSLRVNTSFAISQK